MNINNALNGNPTTALALTWHPDDATLSSGEQALARIVHAVAADADVLDGVQLQALAQALTDYAEHVHGEEVAAMQWLENHRGGATGGSTGRQQRA